MESDTPRTDANKWVARTEVHWCPKRGFSVSKESVDADFARELERELAAMRQQRDEARREVCWFAAKEIVVHNARQFIQEPIPTPEEIALERGWDCFAQEGGGA